MAREMDLWGKLLGAPKFKPGDLVRVNCEPPSNGTYRVLASRKESLRNWDVNDNYTTYYEWCYDLKHIKFTATGKLSKRSWNTRYNESDLIGIPVEDDPLAKGIFV